MVSEPDWFNTWQAVKAIALGFTAVAILAPARWNSYFWRLFAHVGTLAVTLFALVRDAYNEDTVGDNTLRGICMLCSVLWVLIIGCLCFKLYSPQKDVDQKPVFAFFYCLFFDAVCVAALMSVVHCMDSDEEYAYFALLALWPIALAGGFYCSKLDFFTGGYTISLVSMDDDSTQSTNLDPKLEMVLDVVNGTFLLYLTVYIARSIVDPYSLCVGPLSDKLWLITFTIAADAYAFLRPIFYRIDVPTFAPCLKRHNSSSS